MSEGLNTVMLLGNLGTDAQLRTTPGGQPVLSFRLATSESYLDKEKNRQERTEWHSVTIWGRRGEALEKRLTKGSRVFVEGRLHTSSYDKAGQKHFRTEVVADKLLFAGGPRPGAPHAAGRPYAAPNAAELGDSDLPF